MSTLAPTAQTVATHAPQEGLNAAGVQLAGSVTLAAGNTAAATWAPAAQTVATSSANTQ